LIAQIGRSQFNSHFKHALAKEGHPSRSIRLLYISTRRQRLFRIKEADTVESKETSFENCLSHTILLVRPPVEVRHQLSKNPFQESGIVFAGKRFLPVVKKHRCPCMNWRGHVTEVQFVRGHLTAGVKIQRLEQQF